MTIERAAVIGAGTMGAGIAAHLANAGVHVLLLDIVPEGTTNRNALAERAIERLQAARPPAFMRSADVRRLSVGNVEDDRHRIADADWVIEAVVEDVGVKQSVYRWVDSARRPGSIVSSNTSTIPLGQLVDGLPAQFAADFLITHFFNPPRYMRLLELVCGPATRGDVAEKVRDFTDRRLGKSVVDCRDTPGFIANRIGAFWIRAAVAAAIAGGLTVEEADAAVARTFGTSRTGVFGLLDLVGLDLAVRVMHDLNAALLPDDAYHALPEPPDLLRQMVAERRTGRAAGAGFYRRQARKEGDERQAVDLVSGQYRPVMRPVADSLAAADAGPRSIAGHPDRCGRFAWQLLSTVLPYAASLVPDVAPTIAAADEAMRLGYGWRYGPFEMMDALGPAWLVDRLRGEGAPIPPLLERAAHRGFYMMGAGGLDQLSGDGSYVPVQVPPGILRLSMVERRGAPVAENGAASLWDLGDGVACLAFRTRLNTMDRETLAMIRTAVTVVGERFRGLVIGSGEEPFSAGANLAIGLFSANIAAWAPIEDFLREGQQVLASLKYAPFPVVAAPSGLALGGGCELLLHCDAVQAHAESYIGLVETGAGVVPGWGGCGELLRRWMSRPDCPGGPMPPVIRAFETIALARVSGSAGEAIELGFLRATDDITMNRDRLLADAKARVLALASGYRPPEPPSFALPGSSGRAALMIAVEERVRAGKATAHDRTVADRLATVLTGEATDPTDRLSEEALHALERRAVMALIRDPLTLDRMEHLLATGRPLRN